MKYYGHFIEKKCSHKEDYRKLVRILQYNYPKATIAHLAYISSVMNHTDANEMGILSKKM